MSQKHISYNDEELLILRECLAEYVIQMHGLAMLKGGEAKVRQNEVLAGVADSFRAKAMTASAMLERIQKGHTGLSVVDSTPELPTF